MTRKYELLYVLSLADGEEAMNNANERIEKLMSDNAEILDVDTWGKRRLAYEIEDEKEGYYVLVQFNSDPEFPKELDRVLKISDYVLRHLITRVEE